MLKKVALIVRPPSPVFSDIVGNIGFCGANDLFWFSRYSCNSLRPRISFNSAVNCLEHKANGTSSSVGYRRCRFGV